MNFTKIYGCWICYNNIKTLPYSVESVINYVDELVFVDGSFKRERSNDGTWEYVEELKTKQSKPIHHVESCAGTLHGKHNEHALVTGSSDYGIWTWQVDSDEVYTPQCAKIINGLIQTGKYNGIGVKLINIERFDDKKYYANPNIYSIDTTQMRIYRMHNGLHFSSKDGIFEHIVYSDGKPVQRSNNNIYYDNNTLHVYHYHCFNTRDEAIAKYKHYGEKDPDNVADRIRDPSNNTMLVVGHPLENKTEYTRVGE